MSDYLQKGEGVDLVFLHGYLAGKESFFPQIEYFSKRCRVTALDFPGFHGDELPYPYTVDDYCDDVIKRLTALNVKDAYVIAHSFGGRVAIKCLARGIFRGGVLCGCAGIVKKRTMAYRMKVGAYRLCKRLFPSFAERHFGSKEYRSLSPVLRESYKLVVNEDLRETAKRIQRPVLFVTGERDKDTPVSSAKIYQSCVKGSKLLVMRDCGHFAHLDDPLAFNVAVEEFLL